MTPPGQNDSFEFTVYACKLTTLIYQFMINSYTDKQLTNLSDEVNACFAKTEKVYIHAQWT